MYKMVLLSEQGHINAGVEILKIRQDDEIWVNMKHVGDGLNVKNISDLVLKEIHGVYEKKKQQKKKLRITKWQKEKYLKSLLI